MSAEFKGMSVEQSIMAMLAKDRKEAEEKEKNLSEESDIEVKEKEEVVKDSAEEKAENVEKPAEPREIKIKKGDQIFIYIVKPEVEMTDEEILAKYNEAEDSEVAEAWLKEVTEGEGVLEQPEEESDEEEKEDASEEGCEDASGEETSEECGEKEDTSEELSVKRMAVDDDYFTIDINGKTYSYAPAPGVNLSPEEMRKKFDGIAKHSIGKALAWLKKNAVTEQSYRKKKLQEDGEAQEFCEGCGAPKDCCECGDENCQDCEDKVVEADNGDLYTEDEVREIVMGEVLQTLEDMGLVEYEDGDDYDYDEDYDYDDYDEDDDWEDDLGEEFKRVVRGGKVTRRRVRHGAKKRLNGAQKAALRKARRFAHRAGANRQRKISMRKGRRAGLYESEKMYEECSACGCKDFAVKDDVFVCEECGQILNRDVKIAKTEE